MRVLYFSEDYSIHDHRFLKALDETTHEVYFLRLEANSGLENQLPLPAGIKTADWNQDAMLSGGEFDRVQDLVRIIDEVNPDVLHAGPVQTCAYLSARANFGPLLTMSWGSDMLVDAMNEPGRSKAILTLDRSRFFACDCEAVAAVAMDLGMPEDNIVIFPWGVDLEFFSPDGSKGIRAELGWEDKIVLLSTRGHEEIYGVEILLEGFIQAAHTHRNLRLLILNDGSMRTKLERRVESQGMEEQVHFAGNLHLHDLPDAYRTADIYVGASRSDGSSISLLESMASGVPSIVSDILGNREWVEPGVNGWWFEDGDPIALASAIREAADHPELISKFGETARSIAEERANWTHNFQRLLEAYETVLEMSKELP